MSVRGAGRTALVTGITGQDGAYLAQLLLGKGYRVIGTSRAGPSAPASNLVALGIRERVVIEALDPADGGAVAQLLARAAPDEVYHLSGQTSVALSFTQPRETLDSIAASTHNLLEAVRIAVPSARVFVAGSGDVFGETADRPADEATPAAPRSPYAQAKADAHALARAWRDKHGLHASTGILFNHESPLRPDRFVTQKVVRAACAIAAGRARTLELGSLAIRRDWGWAPDYVDAMWRMLQQDAAGDYVIATGETRPLSDFVERAFQCAGLDWREHVVVSDALLRPGDIATSRAEPGKAARVLGWRATHRMDGVAALMVEAELRRAASAAP